MNKKEIKKALNWLLALNIISTDDYNRIYFASLPYLK